MSFITELHCHCSEISSCSNVPAEEVSEKYKKFGYSTLVLTNHFGKEYHKKGMSDEEYISWFFDTQDRFMNLSDDRITVLSAAEILFSCDVLVFGVTKEIMLENPEVLNMNIYDAHEYFSSKGCVMIQAHPMRCGMKTLSLEEVDGYEVFNGNPWADSHNDIALAWAKANDENCIMTGGSDHHDVQHLPVSGIVTDEKIVTMEQLKDVLRSRKFSVYYGTGK